MESQKVQLLESFLAKEMLMLHFKSSTVKKASISFEISLEEANDYYVQTRLKIRKKAAGSAFLYLLLGSIFFGVGMYGTFSNNGYIFYGAILFGFGSLITSIGLFRIVFTRR